jgi:hypothetical protein
MHFTNGWLAFELGVLRRLKFSSVALPFTGEPEMAIHLKRWKVRVLANDPMMWSHIKATALVENHSDSLNAEELDLLLEDAYIPRDKLDNSSLLKWFNETDAWWFDNVRFNAERLDPYKRAIALTAGMMVGDYVLSFNEKTRHLREPLSLSNIFRLMIETLPAHYDNSLRNRSTNQDVRSFVAERHHTDLLFLRLPGPITKTGFRDPLVTWREEWIRGSDDFWTELDRQRLARLGSRVQSKQQYLGLVEDLLRTGSHIPAWAIAHTENGFITNDELVEKVSLVRKTDAIYSKDFSDLLGVRASMLIATA